jgi:hypothetical protein
VVVGLDESGDVVDSKVVADTADGSEPMWRNTLVESDSPTYDSASFTDTTPEFSAASYEFEYQVSDPSNFEEVELLIRNLDNGNVYQTSSSAPDGTISWQDPSYGNGDQYELVAQLQDADGVVVAQETFTDRADGSDGGTPSGSAALEYAGGLQSTEDGQLQFDLTNPDSGQVTVTSVTVTDSFSQRITRSGGPEVQLANGEAAGGGNGFTTDGGRATFSPQATIAGGATETLDFQFFANSGGNRRVSQTTLAGLSQVSSESQADLTIVLETNQGDVTLYFEE